MDNLDVLIVDDETRIVRPLSFLLKRNGYTVDTAYNGDEALEKLNEQHPKLILLDIMIPGKDGYEICSFVKSNEKLKDIHVVMISCKGQKVDKQHAFERGADGYIEKPYSPDDILKIVHQICRG